MPKVKVLVVEDSAVMRRLICDIINEDAALEVVGTAANGHLALLKVEQVNPDVVTLDVEMPEMDGLECLRRLRQVRPHLPVIMFSTVTERCASVTLDALALGANDYVTKPSKVATVAAGWEHVRVELLPKLRFFGGLDRVPVAPSIAPPKAATVPAAAAPQKITPSLSTQRQDDSGPSIVAIGVSTGGPNALAALLPGLAADMRVPIVIVQHMPPVFTKLLADRLASICPFPVVEAKDGEVLRPGQVYIAPGDNHMKVERSGGAVRIRLNHDQPENYCRPAVDVLFRSVREVFGASVLALILTGMGQDGLRGCAEIKEAGGRVLIQDQKSSVVWGMPGAVHAAGLADAAYSIERLASEILVALRHRPTRKEPQLPNVRQEAPRG